MSVEKAFVVLGFSFLCHIGCSSLDRFRAVLVPSKYTKSKQLLLFMGSFLRGWVSQVYLHGATGWVTTIIQKLTDFMSTLKHPVTETVTLHSFPNLEPEPMRWKVLCKGT
eukprot:6470059-Amphidinium_carterae.1